MNEDRTTLSLLEAEWLYSDDQPGAEPAGFFPPPPTGSESKAWLRRETACLIRRFTLPKADLPPYTERNVTDGGAWMREAQRSGETDLARILRRWLLDGAEISLRTNTLIYQAVCKQLASQTDDPSVRNTLLKNVRNKKLNGWIVIVTINSLAGAANHPEVRSALTAILTDDENKSVRRAAGLALENVSAHPEVQTAIVTCMRQGWSDLLASEPWARNALAAPTQPLLDEIVRNMQDGEAWVRTLMCRIAGDLAVNHPVIRQAVTARLEDQNPGVRAAAWRALKPVLHQRTPEFGALASRLTQLAGGYAQSPNLWESIEPAAEVLSGVAATYADARRLLTAWLADENWFVRYNACLGVDAAAAQHPEIRRALTERLEDPEPNVRNIATWTLGERRRDPETRNAAVLRPPPVLSENNERQTIKRIVAENIRTLTIWEKDKPAAGLIQCIVNLWDEKTPRRVAAPLLALATICQNRRPFEKILSHVVQQRLGAPWMQFLNPQGAAFLTDPPCSSDEVAMAATPPPDAVRKPINFNRPTLQTTEP